VVTALFVPRIPPRLGSTPATSWYRLADQLHYGARSKSKWQSYLDLGSLSLENLTTQAMFLLVILGKLAKRLLHICSLRKYDTLNTSGWNATMVIPCACGLFLYALRNTNSEEEDGFDWKSRPRVAGLPGLVLKTWGGMSGSMWRYRRACVEAKCLSKGSMAV
jgi:hypothetical protein